MSSAIACYLIYKFDTEIEEMLPDLACKAQDSHHGGKVDYEKIDPSKYKDMFESPKTFNGAWNHPEPFQRKQWRSAINKEFQKMNLNKVWTKVLRSSIPEGRRCVKHKWAKEACGSSLIWGQCAS